MCTSAASGLFSFPPDQKWRLMAQYAYTRRCVRPSLNKVLHRKLGSRLSKGDEHSQVFKIRAAWTETPSCFPHGFSVDCTGKDQGCRKFVPLRVCTYVNIHRCFGRPNICSACREGDRFDPVELFFESKNYARIREIRFERRSTSEYLLRVADDPARRFCLCRFSRETPWLEVFLLSGQMLVARIPSLATRVRVRVVCPS